ncbi:hypothetical protein MHBO_003047 [Bonamia ostreae]|uniref:Uncharacterized protein n=1 Tax=Bonamia ostreae TaxID=126728 RepID=A0ABV2APY8_9EUKA
MMFYMRMKSISKIPASVICRTSQNPLYHLKELCVRVSNKRALKLISQKCPNLTRIEICATDYNKYNSLEPILLQCRNLTSIKLHHIRLKKTSFSLLPIQIKELQFYDSEMDDNDCKKMTRFKKLENLAISGKDVTEIGLRRIAKSLKGLKHLDIAETTLNPSVCIFLSECLPLLKKLVVNPAKEGRFRTEIDRIGGSFIEN